MERASPARVALATAIAAMRGLPYVDNFSPARLLHNKRGKAPSGMKYKSSSIYWPAGTYKNVQDTRVKNPKIAANIQMMHEKWLAAKKEREHKNSACV